MKNEKSLTKKRYNNKALLKKCLKRLNLYQNLLKELTIYYEKKLLSLRNGYHQKNILGLLKKKTNYII